MTPPAAGREQPAPRRRRSSRDYIESHADVFNRLTDTKQYTGTHR